MANPMGNVIKCQQTSAFVSKRLHSPFSPLPPPRPRPPKKSGQGQGARNRGWPRLFPVLVRGGKTRARASFSYSRGQRAWISVKNKYRTFSGKVKRSCGPIQGNRIWLLADIRLRRDLRPLYPRKRTFFRTGIYVRF